MSGEIAPRNRTTMARSGLCHKVRDAGRGKQRGAAPVTATIGGAQAVAKAIMLVASAFGRSPSRVLPSTM